MERPIIHFLYSFPCKILRISHSHHPILFWPPLSRNSKLPFASHLLPGKITVPSPILESRLLGPMKGGLGTYRPRSLIAVTVTCGSRSVMARAAETPVAFAAQTIPARFDKFSRTPRHEGISGVVYLFSFGAVEPCPQTPPAGPCCHLQASPTGHRSCARRQGPAAAAGLFCRVRKPKYAGVTRATGGNRVAQAFAVASGPG